MGPAAAARILLAALPLLAGCASLYRPPPAPTPLFEEAGELQLGGNLGNNGVGASVAWAPLPHVGLVGSGWGWKTDVNDERRLEGELAVATWLGDGSAWRLEGLAGVGAGRVQIRDDDDFSYNPLVFDDLFQEFPLFRGRLERAFGQANVARVDGPVAYGLATRVAALRFDPEGETGPGRAAWTLEPTAFVRAGPSWLQGEVQVGRRLLLRGELPPPRLGSAFVSVGAVFVFGRED